MLRRKRRARPAAAAVGKGGGDGQAPSVAIDLGTDEGQGGVDTFVVGSEGPSPPPSGEAPGGAPNQALASADEPLDTFLRAPSNQEEASEAGQLDTFIRAPAPVLAPSLVPERPAPTTPVLPESTPPASLPETEALPLSYVSSVGTSTAPGSKGALLAPADPLLSFIASSLAARSSGSAVPPGTPGSVGSRATPTSTAGAAAALALRGSGSVDQWTVDWATLKLDRPVGRGSFGWVSSWQGARDAGAGACSLVFCVNPPVLLFLQVYRASWNQAPVAVKVLISGGERKGREQA